MKIDQKSGKGWAKAFLLALFFLFFTTLITSFGGGVSVAKADSYSGSTRGNYGSQPCTVHSYVVNATVNEDRTIDFDETIEFTLHKSYNVFYRSLPIEGDRYLNVQAEGIGNPSFSYSIADNPEVDGFIDINCSGGLVAGSTLKYRFRYTMEVRSCNTDDGMIIDFVGAGWPIALNNVQVNITFPGEIKSYDIHSGSFGTSGNRYVEVNSSTPTGLCLTAESLPLTTSAYEYGEYAAPITVDFSLSAGAFTAPSASNSESPTLWIPIVLGLLFVGVVVGLYLLSMNRPIISTVVGFEAPNGMDPMELGYRLDGNVDTEDVTSMIYYFASKGYLNISMEGKSLRLLRNVDQLPESETAHAKALFEGLFAGKKVETTVEDLKNKFFTHADKAKVLVSAKKHPMYTSKSVWMYLLAFGLAIGLFNFVPMIAGIKYVGGGYVSSVGLAMLVPCILSELFYWLRENYRYKWSNKKRILFSLLIPLSLLIGAAIYLNTYTHVLTTLERVLTLVFGYVGIVLAGRLLVRREEYAELLGGILGFKEFILVTKKDRLEAMLEEQPELFYDVLPYAQVMGVSDIWEGKFKSIRLDPPRWYSGEPTLFDFWILNSSMRSMRLAMLARPNEKGSTVGRIGGGGFSGGFSGGGGGGGGGGFR